MLLTTLALLASPFVTHFHLVMVPTDIVVTEKLSSSDPGTDYTITTSGDHGFSWGTDPIDGRFFVTVATSTTANKANHSIYLWRRAKFKVSFHATADSATVPGSASWTVGFLPQQEGGYLITAGGSGADAMWWFQLGSTVEQGPFVVTTNPPNHDGTSETFGRSFSSFTGTSGNWVSETTYYDFATKYLTAYSEATLPPGSFANQATSAASSYYFDAPDYTTP